MEFITHSAKETKKLAVRLIKDFIGAKRKNALVFGLSGELGAGKTTFIQGLAKALGVKERILSPTFVIMKHFNNFYHIDCYRINKPAELKELDLEEILKNPKNIIVIEWAEKVKSILPMETIWLEFEHLGKDKRKIKIKSYVMIVEKQQKQKTLVLIDGHALVHRAYHALPRLNTGKGELVNAVYGFILILLKVLKELKPDYIAATFDLAGPTFRHKEFEEYKATRVKAPDELYAQIGRVKEVLQAFNVPIFEKEGFEADDIFGTIAEQLKNKRSEVKTIIVTGDLDTLQLVDKNTEIFTLKKGVKDTILYDEKTVIERYGLKPEQVAYFKGLKGDPSDNIPGVPGMVTKPPLNC